MIAYQTRCPMKSWIWMGMDLLFVMEVIGLVLRLVLMIVMMVMVRFIPMQRNSVMVLLQIVSMFGMEAMNFDLQKENFQ